MVNEAPSNEAWASRTAAMHHVSFTYGDFTRESTAEASGFDDLRSVAQSALPCSSLFRKVNKQG
jgi:hypothetical protein